MGKERHKKAIKDSVLSYVNRRNECLQLSKVSKMLGLNKQEMEQSSIAADLELRAKNRTISKLKRQGDQYKAFNNEIHYLMEP